MSDLKTILDVVPETTRNFLLVFAPTALCFVLIGYFLWKDYTYAETYQEQHVELSQHQVELQQTLMIHNRTLLENQQLMLNLGSVAFAICMNQASSDIAMDRCLKSNQHTIRGKP